MPPAMAMRSFVFLRYSSNFASSLGTPTSPFLYMTARLWHAGAKFLSHASVKYFLAATASRLIGLDADADRYMDATRLQLLASSRSHASLNASRPLTASCRRHQRVSIYLDSVTISSVEGDYRPTFGRPRPLQYMDPRWWQPCAWPPSHAFSVTMTSTSVHGSVSAYLIQYGSHKGTQRRTKQADRLLVVLFDALASDCDQFRRARLAIVNHNSTNATSN